MSENIPKQPKKTRPDLNLIVDTQEKTPLDFTDTPGVTTTRAGLMSGDYSILGMEEEFSIERKSLADLVRSLASTAARERFRRELHRLRGFNYAEIVVIGDPEDITAENYRSKVSGVALWNTLDVLRVEYRVPYQFFPNERAAAAHVVRTAWIYRRWRSKAFKAGNLTGVRIEPGHVSGGS